MTFGQCKCMIGKLEEDNGHIIMVRYEQDCMAYHERKEKK